MSNTQLLSILNNKYFYLGEGNSNIVLSLIDSGLMLRLRKSQENDFHESISHNELKMLNLESAFYEQIMKIIIGNIFIQSPKIVELNKDDIEILNEQLKVLRPSSRQHKQLYCKYGTLTIDYTSNKIFSQIQSPTLCVEIKCKQGWMPEHFRQYGKCMFCINQYLKRERKRISSISGYCPLDLFSGNICRMRKALMELIINPQNNFRVFLSGKQIFGENVAHSTLSKCLSEYFSKYVTNSQEILDFFIDILLKILLNTSPEMTMKTDSDIVFHDFQKYSINKKQFTDKQFCDSSSDGLPSGSVLKRILNIQMLEKGNIVDESDGTPDYSYLEEMLTFSNKWILSNPENVNSFIEKLKPLHKYMLACSAKDCSIMMSLKPLMYFFKELVNDHAVVKQNGNIFVTKIGVIDLDPKPASKIMYHRERDKDVVECFKNAVM